MSRYRYKAVTSAGEVIEGHLDALSREAAIRQIRDLGHLPIRADEAGASSLSDWLNRDVFGASGLTRGDVVEVTREIATLLRADIELDRTLEMIVSFSRRRGVKTVLGRVLDDVRGGSGLADALAKHERDFSRFYVSMVRAGEAGGALDDAFDRLADYLEGMQNTLERVKTALIYPAILMAMAVMSIVILVGFVLPEFKPLFQGTGRELPASTQAVMAVSDFLETNWWALLLAVAVLLLVVHRLGSVPTVRLSWDRNVTKLPLIGTILRNLEVARLTRTLGTLLMNGVPIVPVLEILESTARNLVIQRQLVQIRMAVKQGRGLTETLGMSPVFPARAAGLLHVGEESGKLELMLLKIADIYDAESVRGIERALSLLTPALTIGLGLLIAGIVASMFVAILSVNEIPT